MISAWNLVWIIPVTVMVTIFFLALAKAASDERR